MLPNDLNFGTPSSSATPPVSAAVNSGAVPSPSSSVPNDLNFGTPPSQSTPTNADGSPDHIGWFHQAVQDIASPFLNLGASAATGIEGLGYGFDKLTMALGDPSMKKDSEDRLADIQQLSKGVDVPYLGTATPWGSAYTDPTLSGGQATLKTATQIAGDGLQIASWFTGMGEAKVATEGAGVATDVAKEGVTQMARKTFMQTAMGWVKNALPFSILQGVGTGLGQFSSNVGKGENGDEGQNAISSSETAVLSTAGNIAGFVAMSGATGLIKAFGTKLLASPTVAAANQYLVDTISKVMGVEPKLGGELTGDVVSHVSQALESQITQGHTQIVDAIANTIKTDADPASLFDIVKAKWTPWIDSLFKARDETWRQQGIQNPQIKGGFSDVTNFINQKIQPLLDSKYTVPMGSGQSYTDASKSALANYVEEVKNVLGENGDKVVSRTQIQSLMDRASLFSGDGTEQPMINSLRQLLQQNSIKNLAADPITKSMADLWKKGLDQNSYLQSFMQTKVGGGMRSATQAGDFIDRLFSGKAPGIGEAQEIMNGFGGTGSDALKAFSNLIYDRALKYFPYQSSDYMKGGDLLKAFLDKWDSSKLLTPEDSSALRNFSTLMQNKYGDIVDGVKAMIDGKNPEVTDLASQAQALKGDNVQLRQLQSFQKSLGDNPMLTKNPDGTLNVENLVGALKKSNTNGAYDGIINDLTKLNPAKVETNSGVKVIRSLAKIGLGLPMVLELLPGFNHFAWGASLLFSGGAGAIGLLARDANQISSHDIATWVGKLANETDAKGNSYIKPSFYTDFLSGDYAKAFARLTKLPPDVLKKVPLVVSAIAGKQTYNFADYLGLAQKHMGRDLTPEETQKLQAQFDANQ
jgi:hypothetical protein